MKRQLWPTKQPDTFALRICGSGGRGVGASRPEKETTVSWKPEVIADGAGKWCGNALRSATREEAEANVGDLMMRWFAVRETRVIESDDPVNYRYVDGRLEHLAPE
jgi:hypothetical protein